MPPEQKRRQNKIYNLRTLSLFDVPTTYILDTSSTMRHETEVEPSSAPEPSSEASCSPLFNYSMITACEPAACLSSFPLDQQSESKDEPLSPVLSASVEGADEGFPVERLNQGEGADQAPASGTAFVDGSSARAGMMAGAGGRSVGMGGAARSAMYEAFKQVRGFPFRSVFVASMEGIFFGPKGPAAFRWGLPK